MAKIDALFPSKYIKAADLNGSEITLTMAAVQQEDVGEGEPQPVLYFNDAQKGLVLNRTNADSIVRITGSDETDDWAGHRIALFESTTQFRGKTVACVRVKPPAPPAGAAQGGLGL